MICKFCAASHLFAITLNHSLNLSQAQGGGHSLSQGGGSGSIGGGPGGLLWEEEHAESEALINRVSKVLSSLSQMLHEIANRQESAECNSIC